MLEFWGKRSSISVGVQKLDQPVAVGGPLALITETSPASDTSR